MLCPPKTMILIPLSVWANVQYYFTSWVKVGSCRGWLHMRTWRWSRRPTVAVEGHRSWPRSDTQRFRDWRENM